MSKDNQNSYCKNVTLNIPVVSKTELSLKKTFIRSITGGKVLRTKINDNSSTIQHKSDYIFRTENCTNWPMVQEKFFY